VEYPTNYLIQRLPVAKYLGTSVCIWAAVLALHAACKNFTELVTVRTLLGIFEAVCQPAFLMMSTFVDRDVSPLRLTDAGSMYYKRDEQAQIVTYWYCMVREIF
jgi:hypothetical protein